MCPSESLYESSLPRELIADWAYNSVPMDTPPWWGVQYVPFAEPSRVAFAGCWHGAKDAAGIFHPNYELARQSMRAAADAGVTVIVHTGDFLYTDEAAAQQVFHVERECERLGMTVVVVRGNHDNPEYFTKAAAIARRKNFEDGFARLTPHILHAPNGHRWAWGGVSFVALGGAASVDRPARREGSSWWAKEVASVREVNKVINGGPVDVMVTHDIPLGSDFPFRTPPDWWDMDYAYGHHAKITQAMDGVAPAWVVAGHMHQRHSGFTTTKTGQRVRLEVMDQGVAGPDRNMMIADLVDGVLSPVR